MGPRASRLRRIPTAVPRVSFDGLLCADDLPSAERQTLRRLRIRDVPPETFHRARKFRARGSPYQSGNPHAGVHTTAARTKLMDYLWPGGEICWILYIGVFEFFVGRLKVCFTRLIAHTRAFNESAHQRRINLREPPTHFSQFNTHTR